MGRVQINGERVSLYSDKLSDLINQMEDVKYQMKHGFYCRPKEIRIDEWFNTWIDEYKSLQCKSQTIRLYRNTYKRYIQEPIGRKKVTDVKPAVLQKIINGIHKAGYSRAIITSVQTIIKGMFLQALRDGIIINDPAKNLTLPKFRQTAKTRILLGQNWKEREGLEDLVLFNTFGSSLCDTNVRKDINRIVEQINHDGIKFEHVTPHTFRHTFATRGLEAGIPLKVMQTILGHSSLSMTADLYSHVLPDTKAKEMKELQGII